MITKQELNYIETLYLYANLEEFINPTEHPDIDGYGAYILMMKYLHDTLLHTGTYLNDSNGRAWYKFDSYRMGIMDYNTAKKSNQFNVEIQYEQHHMFTLNKNLEGLDLPFGGTHDQYHIKRIDICKIFKSDIDYTIGYNYISPYRNVNGHNRKENSVYLGNRRNGNVFRMYPKTIELRETENYKKMELLSKYFGDIEDLYTFELELHRSQLKGTLGIATLDDLSKVYQAYKNIVGKIRMYEDNDYNRNLVKTNHRNRINAILITDYVDYERVERKRYKPSKQYAMDKQAKTFNRYIEIMGITEEKEINRLKLEFAMNIASTDNQDITMTYEPSFEAKDYDDMKEKHDRLRNGDSPLDFQAYQAFRPHPYINPDEIF